MRVKTPKKRRDDGINAGDAWKSSEARDGALMDVRPSHKCIRINEKLAERVGFDFRHLAQIVVKPTAAS
jgi:hypothetical protein